MRLALAVQRPSSCVTAFLSTHPPRTEQQVPTVNKHPEGRTPDTINASGAEPVGAQVAVARVQPETSLQGTLETGEAATAGDSAGGAFRQADRKNAAGDRVNPSERTPIQFADKSNAQQVAPGREQVSPVDTAATHLADEQLKTTRARTSVGEHIDLSASTLTAPGLMMHTCMGRTVAQRASQWRPRSVSSGVLACLIPFVH